MTLRTAAIIAGVAGFVSLSCELLWFRVYSYVTGGSPVTFGLLLGIYLAGLAVGADIAGKVCRAQSGGSDARRRLVLAVYALVANLAAFLVVPIMGFAATSPSRGWMALFAVMFASACFGALLPLVSHLGIPPDERAGERLSYVYAANIVGSVCGSLVTGFILMEYLTTRQIAVLVSILGFGLVGAILATAGSAQRRIAAVTVTLSAIGVLLTAPALFDGLYEKLQFKNTYRSQRFSHLVENRHGVVAVTDSGATFGGGVYDGHVSTSLIDNPNGIERAYAVSALHPDPRHVLMIGMSTGAWAQVIANSPLVESLTIVEINPGYLDLVGRYPLVASILRNPKVTIEIDDGRRWLVHNPDRRFEFIVSNTTFHNRSNSTLLLSAEFMRLVHRHLKPGGVFYFNTTGSQDAMKTAFTEFGHGLRVVNFIAASDSPIVIDENRWRDLLATYRIDGREVFDLSNPPERAHFEKIAALPRTIREAPSSRGIESRESVLARIPRARVVTDDNMLPEWRTLILHSSPSAAR